MANADLSELENSKCSNGI